MEEYPPDYKGFYVDIGAHHPWRFSNTYLFYQQQWRGINVDATPGSMKDFIKHRQRDINLEMGVGNSHGVLNFYCFNEPALNTFDENLARERDGKHQYRLIRTIPVQVMPLAALLDQFLPQNTRIDFMTVDVEGLDFTILQTNDWKKYQPKFLLVEAIDGSAGARNGLMDFLAELGYILVARTPRTMILRMQDATIMI
jgi:FkbM family methyltransferase